jgi:hypothetical protein
MLVAMLDPGHSVNVLDCRSDVPLTKGRSWRRAFMVFVKSARSPLKGGLVNRYNFLAVLGRVALEG